MTIRATDPRRAHAPGSRSRCTSWFTNLLQ
jgi:hypothetical protein